MQRNKIYKNRKWEKVREECLKYDHYECQRCNHKVFMTDEPPKLTKAYLVHHMYYVDKYPQYAYSMFVTEAGVTRRNLVSLCFDCHEILHGRKKIAKEKFENEERFD